MNKLTYIAIPYTFNPEESFRIANDVSARFIANGDIVFSPVSHAYPIEKAGDESLFLNHGVWMRQDLEILSRCDKVTFVVIGKDGYKLLEESKGCNMEKELAEKLNLEIDYYEYNSI